MRRLPEGTGSGDRKMVNWHVVLTPVSGRMGAMKVEADEVTIGAGGHLLLKAGDRIVAAIAPGAWVSVEKGLDTWHTST